MDVSFHYPPELLNLLVDTIPLLCRSKQDTLLFAQGAGVSESVTADLSQMVRNDRRSVTKYEIVRKILVRLNQQGEAALRPRRELLKRVLEFEEFTACWESDRLKAQGLVAQLQKLVNVKDSFTRMKLEREHEHQAHIAKRNAELDSRSQRIGRLEAVKSDLFALFAENNPVRRGKHLEAVLNRLFECFDISVRESFTVSGDQNEGVVEQIDGVIELDGHVYFVEMKWWQKPLGVAEISQHMMRVFLRAEARALIFSASEYTAPAIVACKEALSQKMVSLCTLQEVVMLLESGADLREFLRRKVRITILEKEPFPRISCTS